MALAVSSAVCDQLAGCVPLPSQLRWQANRSVHNFSYTPSWQKLAIQLFGPRSNWLGRTAAQQQADQNKRRFF